MHQSDLYLPVPAITTARHSAPARLPAASPTPTWPQSLSGSPVPKKRNVERACDDCRRRKTRCDGPKMPDNVCTNCVQNRKICTYIEASKPRGPPKAYVTRLEDRVEKMEALLKRLRPETDFSAELGPPVRRGSWKSEPVPSTPTSAVGKRSTARPLHQFHPLSTIAPRALSRKASSTSLSAPADRESDTRSDAEAAKNEIIQSMGRLTLLDKGAGDKANRVYDVAFRFHGKSTNYDLVFATREMKTKYYLESMGGGGDVDTMANELERVRANDPNTFALENGIRRQEYWRSPNWEIAYEGDTTPSETFSGLLQHWPPPDLATALMDLYFLHCNSMFPILHRPTFAHHFTDRLYKGDIWFACTCMSVFALASRYTNDSRVLLDEPVETLDENAEHSQWQTAGFKYYFPILEVEKKKRALLNPSSLFEIQTLCLMAQFQSETRWHRGSWYTIGVGIRKMQDIGAHSEQSYKTGPTVENELWKRVWWYLNGLDRMQAAVLGRPCAVKEEDFTAEYPLEVDDEFWENDDPQLAFRQPPDKPSTVAAFNLWLRLTDFAASALHRFDIIEHDGPTSGFRMEDTLNQLNENLTEWAEKVPQHLKWSPDIEDLTLANQSATLYTTYNLITILMQRAFIPSSVQLLTYPRDSRLAPPSLAHAMTARAITINAAKAIARILAVVHRHALSNVPLLLVGAEVTIAVLCIDRWVINARDGAHATRDGKVTPSATQAIESHMQDVKWLLTALRWAAPRWETAQEKLAYLEKIIPDLEKVSAMSGLNIVQEHQHGQLSLPGIPQLSTPTSSRSDLSRLGPYMSADIGMRHAPRREEGPWLADLSRQYTPPQQTSAQSTPRISSHSYLSRIRAGDPAERPQRPQDPWTFSQRSYTTMHPSLLPTSGNPHATFDGHPPPPDFSRVKHEPDGDLNMPPLRTGWGYVTHPHHSPSPHTWEPSSVRGNRYDASIARDGTSSSLLHHLHRPARDYTAPPFHGTGGVTERDSTV